jgi:DNA polymerase IV
MPTDTTRSILHVDMDAFYASVEEVDDPSLRGRPLLVGGPSTPPATPLAAGVVVHGVVTTANYEARKYGCRSAMPMMAALRLCPRALLKPARFHRYREVSRQVHALFERYTPVVEGLSLDEAFLDLTGTERLHGPAEDVARRIKAEILAQTGCTASVGVSYCKFLAKLASDLEKPDGLTVFGPEQVRTVLPTLPVTKIWGVGPKAAEKLEGYGVRLIGDLGRMPEEFLRQRLGSEAGRLLALSRGEDDRAVETDRDAKSIGHEQTFFEPLATAQAARDELLSQVEQVSERLRRYGMRARCVSIKLRTPDFRTVTRAHTFENATDQTREIWLGALGCLETWLAGGFRPLRLLGVTAKELEASAGRESGLFPDVEGEKQSRLDAATDAIRQRFGGGAIGRGKLGGGK